MTGNQTPADDKPNIDTVARTEPPDFNLRAVHFDLKGLPPHPDRLLEWLHVAAAAHYNVVLVEWEDTFPWEFDERVRGELCYTPDTIRAFHALAESLGIEVIPLIQSLGHLEMVLRHPGYEYLREVPTRGDAINPLASGARDLIQTMVDEVMAITPTPTHFHLGGDEAWSFGSHPDTRTYIKLHGKAELYLQHYRPLLRNLINHGIRPILWHDMMYDWEPAPLEEIAGLADLMAWGYQGHPDTTDTHFATRHLKRVVQAEGSVWGSTAFKGGDGFDLDLPDPDARKLNALGWIEVGKRLGFKGLVATGWSRYSSDDIQCYPFEAALDVLATQGAMMYDGEAPKDSMAVFNESPAVQRFRVLQPLLQKFQYHRGVAWNLARQIRTHYATHAVDPRRDTRWVDVHLAGNMHKQLDLLDQIAPKVVEALEESTPYTYANNYVQERMLPLKQELTCFTQEKNVRRAGV